VTSAVPVFRCPKCSREYLGHPPPPSCLACLRPLERLVDRWHGLELEHTPRKPRLLTSYQVRGRKFSRRPAGGVLAPIFGEEIPQAFFLAISALPARGKSTLVLRILEAGDWEQPVLIAAEEGIDSTGLADRMSRAEATKTAVSDAASFPEIAALCEEHRPDCLAIDSATAIGLEPGDCLALRRSWPAMTVIAVLQSLKSGLHAGSQAWVHDCDAFLSLPELGRFALTKCWFSPLIEGDV